VVTLYLDLGATNTITKYVTSIMLPNWSVRSVHSVLFNLIKDGIDPRCMLINLIRDGIDSRCVLFVPLLQG
jgi:hypothetical protein